MRFGNLLIDGDICTTYSDLLNYVNKTNPFRPAVNSKSLPCFIFNLISAIAGNRDISIDDDVFNFRPNGPPQGDTAEGGGTGNLVRFKNMDELLHALKFSKSKISLYTSGTSGIPKRVEHPVGNLLRGLRESEAHSDDIWGLAYAPSHMAGIQVLFQVIFNGNTAVNLSGKSRRLVLKSIDAYKISHISATPTFYKLLLPADKPLLSVKRATLGGEASVPILYSQIRELFPNAKITNIYASTEFGTLLVSNGNTFKIPRELDKLVRIKNGELQVHRSLCGSADQYRFDGEFAITGDIVKPAGKNKDEFYFSGRSSNIINVGGFNVAPEEVEDAIMIERFVGAALVYGKKNSVLGNVLCADVVLKFSVSDPEEKLRKSLAQRLQQYKIPRKFRFVERLPTSSTCKIKR